MKSPLRRGGKFSAPTGRPFYCSIVGLLYCYKFLVFLSVLSLVPYRRSGVSVVFSSPLKIIISKKLFIQQILFTFDA